VRRIVTLARTGMSADAAMEQLEREQIVVDRERRSENFLRQSAAADAMIRQFTADTVAELTRLGFTVRVFGELVEVSR
jgi:hypothetical protein